METLIGIFSSQQTSREIWSPSHLPGHWFHDAEGRISLLHATSQPGAGWTVATDARLDGRNELATRLGLPPHEAAGFSDRELTLRAFLRWGAAAPEYLFGDFAILAWEQPARRLHLFTDTGAGRALYYHRNPRRLLVCNRAPLLLAAPEVPRRVDTAGLLRYFTDQRGPRKTVLAGIEAVPCGHHIVFDSPHSNSSRRWWTPPQPLDWTRKKEPHPVETFREIFRTATSDRLRTAGENPGAFCSGGLDSSSICATAASILANTGRRFRTYTQVPHPDWQNMPPFPGRDDDESPQVRALAQLHPNIDATFVAVDGAIFLDCLPAIFSSSAGPVRNTSNMPWYLAIALQMQKDGVTLPFSGEFGNVTISHDHSPLADLLAARRWDLLANEFLAAPAYFFRQALAAITPHRLKQQLRRTPSLSPVERWRQRVLLNPGAARAHGLASDDDTRFRPAQSTGHSRLRFLHLLETFWLLPFEGLMTSTNPTVDRRVVEFCWSLPPTEFRHGREDRHLIRRAMAGLLPDSIRLRTRRGLQAADNYLHLSRRRSDLRDAVEYLAADTACTALIDIPALRNWLDHWPEKFSPSLHATLAPFERAITMGLYLRWINEGLTELPGARPLSPSIISSFTS